MKSNPSHESFGNISTNIIRVMQNIGLTTSPDRTTSTPENIEATIDQMAHDIPIIYSWIFNVFSSLLSEHKNLYSQDKLMYIIGTYMLRANR